MSDHRSAPVGESVDARASSPSLRPNAMLTPFDDLLWELRIAASQVSAARTDWDRVASGSPGHEIRRHLARCADAIGQARAEIARQRRPPPWWREEVEQSLRAARRLIVRQQIACFGRWWPPGRRYLG